MRLKNFLPLLCLFALQAAVAQTLQFRLGGGFADHYGASRTVGAFKVGLAYEHEFSQKFTFAPGIYFYGKGWKEHDVSVPLLGDDGLPCYDTETGEQLFTIKNVSSNAYYVTLPLLFNYYVRTGEGSYVVLGAGPYAAIGVGGRTVIRGDGTASGASKFLYRRPTFGKGTHLFDGGIEVQAGYQFANGLIVAAEADFGLLNFNTAGNKNRAALLTLTYKLAR